MRAVATILVNTSEIELWPSQCLRARSNRDARAIARSDWVLRRKRDGQYLAAGLPEGLQPLIERLPGEPGLAEALYWLEAANDPRRPIRDHVLALHGLQQRLDALGIDDGYGQRSGLDLVAEPRRLSFAGLDRYRRPLWLRAGAARAWLAMRHAAWRDGIRLDAISGYRSHDYQLGIFQRKLARGLCLGQILEVNAAPGYSEHHDGTALDIGTPGEPPAEESFESTAAFAWLVDHAGGFHFRLSYPRGNRHGIVYEPWHWRWHPVMPGGM